jgi:outer membrane protein
MNVKVYWTLIFLCLTATISLEAQTGRDTILSNASLETCISYALEHQPSVQQALLDEAITENAIKTRLADWYPQVAAGFSAQHYFQLPTAFIPSSNGDKVPFKSGLFNSSYLQVGATQNLFSRDLLLARRTAGDVRLQARQQTTRTRIDVVVDVSKAFYDVLLTQKQVQVLDENILRLQRSLQDAYNQYQAGVVDKIDYKRAQISLNNTIADRKRVQESIDAKFANLKQLLGYDANKPLGIVYDSLTMENAVPFDTLQQVNYTSRIEYQTLQTEQRLLQSNIRYYRTSYLPNVSAFLNYTPNFYNDRFFSLYNQIYPTSQIGIQFTVPLFQGGKRIYNVRTAELQYKRLEWDMANLTHTINTQYAQALAAYKGNLAEWRSMKENRDLAQDVYNTLQLQYKAGIKTYLDVIIAETDLRATQLNYLDALYNVLASKLDLQKALGTINY